MSDLLGILVSGIMMMVVAYRAIQLDAAEGWFQRSKPSGEEAATDDPVAAKTRRRGNRAN